VIAGNVPVLVHNCGPNDTDALGNKCYCGGPAPTEYGPFYRAASKSQTDDAARQMLETNELWGGISKMWGGNEAARAYQGSLPEGTRGIEFYTPIRPRLAFPREVWWEDGRGIEGLVVEDGWAKIPVRITKNTQIPDWPE